MFDLRKELDEAYNKTTAKRVNPNGKKVCVLYTGGTAGMVFNPLERNSLELVQADAEQLINKLPRLKREDVEVDFYSFKPALDSSNIGSEHWLLIAVVIELLAKHYEGFVVIHGTNTMAYTASAVSFLFGDTANKPLILTGSELALSERNNDAEPNIYRSIEIATRKDTSNIQGVCILFGKWLLRGNRATKQIALDKMEGFYSPNYPEIASVSSDKVIVNLAYSKKTKSTNSFEMNKFISSVPKVAICDIYPDMDMNAFKANCTSSEVEAVILRTYGTGGVPDKNPIFRECLESLQSKNTIVVNLTQCPKGTSEFRLFETNETLFNYGVISGGDMVTEAAYCKLKHLFSKFNSVENRDQRIEFIKHYMMVSIQGEMSRSMFVVPVLIGKKDGYPELKLTKKWSSNPAINKTSDEQDLSLDSFAMLDANQDLIVSAVLRLGKVMIVSNAGMNRVSH
jgi:L-asparaginase